MHIKIPLKVVAGVVCSFTHRMGWANGLSTEFVLVVILYLDCKINSTQCLNSSIAAKCKNFQLLTNSGCFSFFCVSARLQSELSCLLPTQTDALSSIKIPFSLPERKTQ